MKKLLLAIALSVVSFSVMAADDWVKRGTYGDITLYLNISSRHKIGHFVKMWELLDYKTTRDDGDGLLSRSAIARVEFDCEEKQFRAVSGTTYSENMREGKVVWSGTVHDDWESVIPGSAGERNLEIACSEN